MPVAQTCESSLRSSVSDISLKLLDIPKYVLPNYLPAIIHMLMRCNNIKTMTLKSHCCLQDDVLLMHFP